MTYIPQLLGNYRSTRIRLADMTPAVLRFQDGRRSPGKLQVVSLTGGLLSVPEPLDQGSRVKLMFLTGTGTVLGAAEMLTPVSASLQPFRFVALEEGDHRRLRAAIQTTLGENSDVNEEEWIEKYRAALVHQKPARWRFFRTLLAAVTLLALCLGGSAIYVFNLHLR